MTDNIAVEESQVVAPDVDANGFTAEEVAEQQRVLLLLLDMEV